MITYYQGSGALNKHTFGLHWSDRGPGIHYAQTARGSWCSKPRHRGALQVTIALPMPIWWDLSQVDGDGVMSATRWTGRRRMVVGYRPAGLSFWLRTPCGCKWSWSLGCL